MPCVPRWEVAGCFFLGPGAHEHEEADHDGSQFIDEANHLVARDDLGCFGERSPSARWRSVRHTPQTRTCTRTLTGAWDGTLCLLQGLLSMGPGRSTVHAFMVWTVMSVRATPGLGSGHWWHSAH